jgi:hypothetical protein
MIRSIGLGNYGEGRIWIWGFDYNAGAGIVGTWVQSGASVGQMGNIYNSSAANADQLAYTAYFAKGHYVGRVVYDAGPNNGKMTIKVGNLAVLSAYDTYGAAAVYAAGYAISPGFDITRPGIYTITFLVDGKNGASGGYKLYLYYFSFWRTT